MAIQKYVAERLNTTVQKSGFIIHAENGWLGATPDDVHDETGHSDGILEVKCLYSQREVSPKQACIDSTFFVNWWKVKFDLRKVIPIIIKSSCNCTLGMIISSGVIFAFSCKGLPVQRIFPDTK